MLEGDDIGSMWDWKASLGPLRNRRGHQNTWGYQMTNGLGLMEYLELAEDMDMEISTCAPPPDVAFNSRRERS